MTESQSGEKQPSASSSNSVPENVENAVPVINQPAAQKNSGGKALSVFACLFSLAALGASAYTWYDNQVKVTERNAKLSVGVTDIGGQVARLGDQMARLQQMQTEVERGSVSTTELNAGLEGLKRQVTGRLDTLQRDQTELTDSVQKVTEEMRQGANQFIIEEVAQLLRLASNSAVYSSDAPSAINALTLADSQLKVLSDPRFALVRREINKEIAELQAAKAVDKSRVTALLSAMSERIDELPLENMPEVIEPLEELPEEDTSFKGQVKLMFKNVANPFTVRKVEKAPKPLLAPKERYFLDQNIKLELNQAELAVMQNRGDVFQRSLETAANWINEYFDLNNADVKDVLEQLQSLQAEPVGEPLPNVSGSFEALTQVKGGE